MTKQREENKETFKWKEKGKEIKKEKLKEKKKGKAFP